MWHQIIFFYSRHLCSFIIIFIILFFIWICMIQVFCSPDKACCIALQFTSLFKKHIYHSLWYMTLLQFSFLRILFVTSFTVPRSQKASRQHFLYAIFCLSLMMNILFSIRYVTCRKTVYHYFLKILPYNSISVCRSFE